MTTTPAPDALAREGNAHRRLAEMCARVGNHRGAAAHYLTAERYYTDAGLPATADAARREYLVHHRIAVSAAPVNVAGLVD